MIPRAANSAAARTASSTRSPATNRATTDFVTGRRVTSDRTDLDWASGKSVDRSMQGGATLRDKTC
jgi:hypothetical protein